MRTTNKNFQS